MKRVATTLVILTLTLGVLRHAPGQSPMDAAAAEKTRYDGTVVVWYGSHFEETAAHDWDPIREWNGPFHPLLGEYKTDNVNVIRQHLQWMRRAGVDVICYDAVRINPELTLLDLPKQKTLQLLVEELSHQEKETRKLKLIVWLEKWNTNPTPGQYRFGIEYILKNFASGDFYYRLDGKPLIMSYFNGKPPDVSAIDSEFEPLCTLRRISSSSKAPGWKYIGPAGDKECMTVNPGVDGYLEQAYIKKYVDHKTVDTEALREHGKVVVEKRADGKPFESQLLKAREADPKIIFISGWNDWAYCLQMEPTKEYGFKYVDIAARLIGRGTETLPYRKIQ